MDLVMSDPSVVESGMHTNPRQMQYRVNYPTFPDHSMPHAFLLDPIIPDTEDNLRFSTEAAHFQPCDDCTPATQTTIPHHHHKHSGRLAGTSATLDGHFCCSWLVHGQPCYLCFESAEALDNHIKNDHAGKDGTYRCLWQDCSKHDHSTTTSGPMNFGNKPKLMRHIHSHTGYKPFPCSFPGCGKGFVTKEQLKNHETTHTKSRKYKCEYCGKAFAVKSALTTHITAVHDEKKIHTCEICGKAFADSSNLSKHRQTHYRDNAIRKRRSKRSASDVASSPSTASISTPSMEPAATFMHFPNGMKHSAPPVTYFSMAPPALPNPLAASSFAVEPVTFGTKSTPSTTSSPPPESFDPNCYCCDMRCPGPEELPCEEAETCDLDSFCCDAHCTPPEGPATPCDSPDECDLEGFCDLPECLAQNGYLPAGSATEASASCCHCNEPLLHHQIEHLKNFQATTHREASAGSTDHVPKLPLSQMELEHQFSNMHGS